MLADIELVKRRSAGLRGADALRLNRRTLLASTALIALAASVAVGPVDGWAAAGISADQRVTLIRLARDIYPHDELLPDEPYVTVVDRVLDEAKGNDETRKLVLDGLADLEARSQKVYGKTYVGIPEGFMREGLLRSIELSPFFQRFRGELLMGLYDNKSLYPKFGYDGSSWERGGFMDSFDKIDWL